MENATGEIDSTARNALDRLHHQLRELDRAMQSKDSSSDDPGIQQSVDIPKQLESLEGRIESLGRKLDSASPETHRILQQAGGPWLEKHSQLDKTVSNNRGRSDLHQLCPENKLENLNDDGGGGPVVPGE